MAPSDPRPAIDSGLQKMVSNSIEKDVDEKVAAGVGQALDDARDGIIRNEDGSVKKNPGIWERIVAWITSLLMGWGDFGKAIAGMFGYHIPEQHEVKELSQQVTQSISETLATKDASGQLAITHMSPQQLETTLRKKIATDIADNPLLADAFSAKDIEKTARIAAKDAAEKTITLMPQLQAYADADLSSPTVTSPAPGQAVNAPIAGASASPTALSREALNAPASPEFAATLTTMANTFILAQDSSKHTTDKDVVESVQDFVRVGAGVVRAHRSELENDPQSFSKRLIWAVINDPKMGDDLRKKAREKEPTLFGNALDADVNRGLYVTLKQSLDSQLKDPQLVQTLLAQTVEAPAANVAAAPANAETPASQASNQPSYAELSKSYKQMITNMVAQKIEAEAVDKSVAAYHGSFYLRNINGPSDASMLVLKNSETHPKDEVETARRDIYKWAYEHEYAPDRAQATRIGMSVADSIIPVLSDPQNAGIPREEMATKLRLAVQKGLENDATYIDSVGRAPIKTVNHRTFGANEDVLGKVVAGTEEIKTDNKMYEMLQGFQTTLVEAKAEEKNAQLAAAAAAAGIDPKAKGMVTDGQTPQGPGGKQLANLTQHEVPANGVAGG